MNFNEKDLKNVKNYTKNYETGELVTVLKNKDFPIKGEANIKIKDKDDNLYTEANTENLLSNRAIYYMLAKQFFKPSGLLDDLDTGSCLNNIILTNTIAEENAINNIPYGFQLGYTKFMSNLVGTANTQEGVPLSTSCIDKQGVNLVANWDLSKISGTFNTIWMGRKSKGEALFPFNVTALNVSEFNNTITGSGKMLYKDYIVSVEGKLMYFYKIEYDLQTRKWTSVFKFSIKNADEEDDFGYTTYISGLDMFITNKPAPMSSDLPGEINGFKIDIDNKTINYVFKDKILNENLRIPMFTYTNNHLYAVEAYELVQGETPIIFKFDTNFNLIKSVSLNVRGSVGTIFTNDKEDRLLIHTTSVYNGAIKDLYLLDPDTLEPIGGSLVEFSGRGHITPIKFNLPDCVLENDKILNVNTFTSTQTKLASPVTKPVGFNLQVVYKFTFNFNK